MSSPTPPSSGGSSIPKAAWIAMGTIGTLIVVLLAAVLYKLSVPSSTVPTQAASAPTAQASSSAPPGSARQASQSAVAVTGTSPSRQPATSFPPMHEGQRATTRHTGEREPTSARRTQSSSAENFAPQTFPNPSSTQQAPAAAPTCSDCGTVTAVVPVNEPGQSNGVGAVVGGLVGGLLGNQVGGGNGRTAATVIGAVGGGLAGNEVQKRMNTKTLYQVHVRMDDGATRTITLSNAPPVGQRVRVQADGSLSPM